MHLYYLIFNFIKIQFKHISGNTSTELEWRKWWRDESPPSYAFCLNKTWLTENAGFDWWQEYFDLKSYSTLIPHKIIKENVNRNDNGKKNL